MRLGARAKPVPADPPDQRQLIAGTLLFGLSALPLLFDLDPRVSAFIAGMLALQALSIRFPRLRPGMLVLLLLTLVGGLNVVDAYRGIAGQGPGTALLLSMVALKLLEVRTRRDLRVLLLVLGFLLVVQFLFDDSPWRLAAMVAILLGAFALLLDLTLPTHARGLGMRTRASLAGAAVMMAQALPLALVLFVFFPRLDAPLWDLGIENPHAVTGLKDWLEPGSIKDLVVSGEDVMRVRFDREPGMPVERMYWRGPVLWHAVGNRFSPARPGDFPDAEVELEPLAEPLDYTALLEATDQRWITALDWPLTAPLGAELTADGQLLADRPIDERRMFRLRSAPAYRAGGLSLEEEAAALALPDTVTERMRALVASWTADDPPPATVVERALAHFNEQPFRYSLLAPDMGPKAMDDFLFDSQVGFCEHYAAAFTLLMRIAGLPTRIALGYMGGELNPYSGDYVVRQSEAHAWTEVWLGEQGWTRVDPTAAVAAERVDPDGSLARLGAGAPARFRLDDRSILGRTVYDLHLLLDAANIAWRRWVVGFSHFKQQQMLRNLGLDALRDTGLVLLMALAGAGVMLAWGLWLGRPAAPADPVQAAYAAFQRKLRRVDAALARHPDEGPLDHLTRLGRLRPYLAAAATPIVQAYVRLRYDNASPQERGLDQLREQVRAFRPGRQGSGRNGSTPEPS
jgi:protein-glutamine gamma-glutamyltransferase